MHSRRVVTIGIVCLLAASAPAEADKKPKANDCGDPYWAPSLRCNYAAADEAPQANLGDRPVDVDAIRPFTRVFLTDEPSVRSVDGTYPVMYVDQAICTAPITCGDVPRGEPVRSDRWLITVPGGGACTRDDCVAKYAEGEERREMSTAADPPTQALAGIHTPDEDLNPVFAGYNRIRVEKSSYDRYMGRATYEAAGGEKVFSHGFLIMEQALRALRNGLRYETWVDRDGEVTTVRERLPALAKADQVVFVGHSGGSHGLFHNIDHLAGLLESFGGFGADVRAIFDANFVPGIENEAAFDDLPGGNAYSRQWSGTSTVSVGSFTYDGEAFLTTGDLVRQYADWGAEPDASCLAAHAATDGATWKCGDRQHVLFNHITTPFLVKEDFRDPNGDHNDKPFGHAVRWGNPITRLTQEEYGMRVEAQAQALIEHSSTRSELGAAFPTFFVWMPDCGKHSGVYDDDTYFHSGIEHGIANFSLRQWVERFVAAPRHGASEWRIDGYPGPIPTRSRCPS